MSYSILVLQFTEHALKITYEVWGCLICVIDPIIECLLMCNSYAYA